MKIVETKGYVAALRELTEEGKEVSMRIAGNSMAPFLVHDRDYIKFKKPERELRKGDMVFFQREDGQFIMHRIWKVKKDGYYIVGDAQQMIEGPVRREQIFSRIIGVQRKGKWIGPGDFWWEFFEHIWLHLIPARRFLMKGYSIVKGTKHEENII